MPITYLNFWISIIQSIRQIVGNSVERPMQF